MTLCIVVKYIYERDEWGSHSSLHHIAKIKLNIVFRTFVCHNTCGYI